MSYAPSLIKQSVHNTRVRRSTEPIRTKQQRDSAAHWMTAFSIVNTCSNIALHSVGITGGLGAFRPH